MKHRGFGTRDCAGHLLRTPNSASSIMAAPPSYEEHTRRWALEACADDPAMQAAFRAAGARDGWVAGLSVRAYCEREGLMQTATSQRGVPKQALARAWALADAN